MNFIVYDAGGRMLRQIQSPPYLSLLQAKDGEFVMEGTANDKTQKIENPGIAGKVIDKTSEEIEAEKPAENPFEKLPAHITNEQWQKVQDRLNDLEKNT